MLDEIYPDSKNYNIIINTLEPQDYLKESFEKLASVARFQDPANHIEGMILDNTKIHTLRCVYRSLTIPYLSDELTKILWIHDISESGSIRDTSAVERYHNKKQSKKNDFKESMIAKSILNESDYERYRHFVTAEDFVRRSGKSVPENQDAILANIIDYMDGNLVYTYYFTNWLMINDYDGERPSKKVFFYNVNIIIQTVKSLKSTLLDINILKAANYLMHEELATLLNLWSKVPYNKVPFIMRGELDKMRELCKNSILFS